MHTSFVERLMDHIIQTRKIPKVQIERAVGPILSIFIDDVLTETLSDDPDLSGPLAVICPEFPLKKSDNCLSTNIDWLMYNTVRRQLLFVELKTSATSVTKDQIRIYHDIQKSVNSDSGSFLVEDVVQVKGASTKHEKYRYLWEKVSQYKNEISECRDAKIIYLVPKSAEHKVQGRVDKVLTFGMLSNSITGPFANEWTIIQSHLCSLDDSSQRVRNRQSRDEPKTNRSKNFEDCCDFRSIVELCEKMGDDIIVGFTGGEIALARRDISSLERRIYKWDHAIGGTGNKDSRNWIHGSVFLRIIN